jgi:hypothetical protein
MATITCFALDSNDDLQIESGVSVVAEDTTAIKTMLKCKLNQIKGDWFLDLNEGLDYFGAIWGKTSPDIEMDSEFKIGIKKVIGVTEISSFTSEIDSDRQLQVVFKIGTVFSQDIDSTEIISTV